MRLTIVSPNFPPEPGVSSMTVAQTAHFMTARGHEVTVVTGFPSRPQGRPYPGFKRRMYRSELTSGGYRLVRCFSAVSSRSSLWSRFLENISFGLTSGWLVLTARRPDAVYANTWAIFASAILALATHLRRVNLILNIQDLYPESLIVQGRIGQKGTVHRGLLALDRRIAKSASAVVLPAPSFVEAYRRGRGVRSDKLHFVPNWLDASQINPDDPRASEFRQRLGIPDDATVFFFGGNIGAAAGVETVIEAFGSLPDVRTAYLVIAGAGANFGACRRQAAELSNPRIRFHNPWPAGETSAALAAADLLILPTRGRQSLASIPSKLIAYMLAARPVLALALAESDLAGVIRDSGSGWVIEPDEPTVLAEKMREVLGQSREAWRSRGRSGRAFALSNFAAEACLPRIADIIEGAASS